MVEHCLRPFRSELVPAEGSHAQLCARLISLPKPGRELMEFTPLDTDSVLEAHSSIECLYCKHICNVYKSKVNYSWNGKIRSVLFSASSSLARIALKLRWPGHYQQHNQLCKEFISAPSFQFSGHFQSTALKLVIRLVPAPCFEWDTHWAGHWEMHYNQ